MQAEVFAKVEELFKDAPDLCAAFRDFLPGASAAQDSDGLGVLRSSSTRTGTPIGEHARVQKRKKPAESTATPASAPTKRRRKVAERDKEKEQRYWSFYRQPCEYSEPHVLSATLNASLREGEATSYGPRITSLFPF